MLDGIQTDGRAGNTPSDGETLKEIFEERFSYGERTAIRWAINAFYDLPLDERFRGIAPEQVSETVGEPIDACMEDLHDALQSCDEGADYGE